MTPYFSERWLCAENTTLLLRKNGRDRDNIPLIQSHRGTWLFNGEDVTVFDDADDDNSDARAYGMKISLRSTGRGPNEETLEL